MVNLGGLGGSGLELNYKKLAMKNLETESSSQREQQVKGLSNKEAGLYHRRMGTVAGGEIRQGARIRPLTSSTKA